MFVVFIFRVFTTYYWAKILYRSALILSLILPAVKNFWWPLRYTKSWR